MLIQLAGKNFALFHAHGADQYRLTQLVSTHNVFNHGIELGGFRFVDEIGLIDADHFAIGRNRNDLQTVCVHEFGSFGLRGTSHSRKLRVHPEIVLQCDRRQGLIFFLDTNALFGFDGLMYSLTPTSSLEYPTGEFIHDLYFAILDDVILVAVV